MKRAIRRLPNYLELISNLFPELIKTIWVKMAYEAIEETNIFDRNEIPNISLNILKQNVIRKMESEIRNFLQDDTGFDAYILREKKKKFASHYDDIFQHWKEMQRLQIEGKNWRRYIKAGDMSDISDDLIEDFEKGKDMNIIALEHAARRAQLLNTLKLSTENKIKREQGIMCSGYTRSVLYQFKKEGEELLNGENQSGAKTSATD